ncbi:MAG TPA: Hsp20/alpha crystallin family protein [Micromonosporaceae bacterium]
MSYPVGRSRGGWDPIAELEALRSEVFRRVGSALGGTQPGGAGGWHPDVEVDEDENVFTVVARLPGVAPDEVMVDLDDRDLHIRARHEKGEAEGASSSSDFDYRVTLPSDVDPEGVDATMDHGLLTVTLPKRRRAQPRRISVSRGGTISGTTASSGGTTAVGEAPVPGHTITPPQPGTSYVGDAGDATRQGPEGGETLPGETVPGEHGPA